MGSIIAPRAVDIAAVIAESTDDIDQSEMSDYEFPKRLNLVVQNFMEAFGILKAPPSKPKAALSDDSLCQSVLKLYKDLDINALNIAFMGNPDSDKIALINAFMGKEDLDEAASNTATQFIHPVAKHIRFWNLLDNGNGQPAENYYLGRCMYAFDLIIFVSDKKIRPVDLTLAKQCLSTSAKTQVAFVNSKINDDVDADESNRTLLQFRVKIRELDKDQIIKPIRQKMQEKLNEANLDESPIWLISVPGLLDVNAVEDEAFKYVVDEFQPYFYMADYVKKYRRDAD